MNRNMFGIVIAAAGIALLLYGALSPAWWTASQDPAKIELGLRSVHVCQDGACQSLSYEKVGSPDDKAFVTAGNIAYYGALVTAGVIGLVVLLGLLGATMGGSIAPARIGVALSLLMLVTAVAFVFLRPDTHGLALHTAKATYCYFIGTVVAVIGSLSLAPISD